MTSTKIMKIKGRNYLPIGKNYLPMWVELLKTQNYRDTVNTFSISHGNYTKKWHLWKIKRA
jgi:hypothetical protein